MFDGPYKHSFSLITRNWAVTNSNQGAYTHPMVQESNLEPSFAYKFRVVAEIRPLGVVMGGSTAPASGSINQLI